MKKLAARLLVAIAVLYTTLQPHPAAAKDELVIGITQFPSTFHPNIDALVTKTYILGFTQRPFTVYDKDWGLICLLCTELPTIENGLAVPETTPDGKKGIAVTYTIQPNAKWGDGTPVTTKDVTFTWEVGRQGQTGVTPAEFYRSTYKVTVKDDKTFTLHFDKLTFNYNAINSFNLVPAHLEDDAFRADPVSYKNRTTFDTDTTNKGLYFGPYVIARVEAGSHVVLEQNPHWWGKKPSFKRIVVRIISNTAALEANLLSGNIDMIAGELGLSIDQALAFEKRHKAKFTVIHKPGLIYEHIDFNLDTPIFKDKRVRQGLLHGIDREAISKRLFGGRQPVAHSNVNPLDWVSSKTVPTYAFDPKKAVALLEAAGYTKKIKGIRHHDKTGAPLRFDLMTTAGNRTRELVQQVLQSQWKSIGVDARIKNEPARVFFGRTVTQRRFKGLALYAWSSAPESVPRTTLHSEQIPTEANGYSGQNYPGFKNAEMDQLIDKIEVELDRPNREKLWHRLQDIYADELPAMPLYFRANSFILPKWISGIEPTGHSHPTSLWAEHWRAKPAP